MTAVLTLLGWLDLLGTAALAGGVAYASLVVPLSRGGRRVAHGGALLVALTLVLELGMTSFRLNEFVSGSGWSLFAKILGTQWGALWVARCVGLAAVVACPFGSRAQVILVALWLLARSLQGHAGAHGAVPAAIDWVHLSAACVWLGGLLQFLLSRPPSTVIAMRLRRSATLSIAALLPAGVYGAWLHVPTPADLIRTTYGWVLLAKIALAIGLFTLGARNHFVHVPAAQREDPIAFGLLRESVRLEVAGGALVLLLSALLGALPMPAPTPH